MWYSRVTVNQVSVLFNEPKLLKSSDGSLTRPNSACSFSALQRAEIAEIRRSPAWREDLGGFSALQRAEIAEIDAVPVCVAVYLRGFSALQRAEIAEIINQPLRSFLY